MPAISAPLGPPSSFRSSSQSDTLRRVNFRQANLSQTIFSQTILRQKIRRQAILRGAYRSLTGVALALLAIGCSERETPMAPSEQGPRSYGLAWEDGTGDAPTRIPVAAPPAAPRPAPTADFVNGSFETGDYTGWTLFEGGFRVVPDFGAWGIAENGQTINRFEEVFDFFDGIFVEQRTFGLPHTYTTSDGDFVALQLVRGPQTHRMYQDLALPDGAETLSWAMEYTNHSLIFLDIDFNPNQEIRVTVRDPVTDEILATLFVTEPGSPQSIPMTIFVRDISAFGGQTVRIGVDMTAIDFLFDAAFDNFVAHSSLDLDQDGTLDLPDDCPDVFGPADNLGCPRPEVPEGTEISTDPRPCEIDVDGGFGSNGCVEWADVTPVVVLGGESIVYQSLDPGGADLFLMYDFIGSQTPLEPGVEPGVEPSDEGGQVRFFVGTDVFDVYFIQGGPPGSGGEGDAVRVLKNRLPFDNALGSIEGAVDFNSTSPNFADPHNLFELRIRLLETEETPGGSPPSEGGLYGPEPVFLGASLPADRLLQVSSTVVEIGSDGQVNTLVTPLREAMDIQVEEAVVKLDRRPGRHRFEVEGTFELGPDGMTDVVGEDVEVRLFGLFEQTIQAGAFIRDHHDEGFEFKARSSGIFDMCIDDDGRFEIEIRRIDFTALDLDKLADEPVLLYLRIGNDVGEFSIQFDADGEFGVEKSGRSARSGKSDRSGKSAKSGRSDKSGRSARSSRSDRSGKSAKSGKSRR